MYDEHPELGLAEIGEKFDVTGARIWQIVTRYKELEAQGAQ